jgi:hypothetical protein
MMQTGLLMRLGLSPHGRDRCVQEQAEFDLLATVHA